MGILNAKLDVELNDAIRVAPHRFGHAIVLFLANGLSKDSVLSGVCPQYLYCVVSLYLQRFMSVKYA